MRLLLSLALILLAGANGPALGAPPDRNMKLVFEENFDRDPAAGGRWLPTVRKDTRFLNDERQFYADRSYVAADGSRPGAHPFSVRRGILSISARPTSDPRFGGKDYVSGALSTEGLFEFRYGYAEIRARLPKGAGVWAAFWLMRSGATEPYGEIDVMESIGQDPRVNFATVHSGPTWAGRAMHQIRTIDPEGLDRGFHTYGVDWTERSITLYVDGEVTGWMTTPPELKAPMFPIVNLAVGGLAGRPDARTRFPAVLSIDHVRIWQRPADIETSRRGVAGPPG